MKKITVVLLALALPVFALSGCAAAASDPATVESAPALSGTVTVFAAASLTESFTALAEAFEAENPGVDVVFSFGGSSGLATQILQGAPADVFAAASPTTMATVTDSGVENEPQIFATNVLEIAVPAGNPAGITGLDDFAKPDLAIALCAVEVPCGSASAKLLSALGITASVDTYEQDVKAVLTKVELGEVDAGLVYVTDVRAAGEGVHGISVVSDAVAYPILQLSSTDAAAAFIAFVLSDAGQRTLAEAGFGAP